MTSNMGADTRILGTLKAADGKGVVRIEDRYDTDIEDLWSALTEPRRLARWYGEIEGDFRVGGEFHIYLEAAGLRGVGRVEVCDRPSRLTVVTRETDESARQGQGRPPFDHAIEATLTVDGDQTHLVIETTGMPLETIASYGAGWQIHAENLAAYLAGEQPADGGSRWADILPSYRDMAVALG